MRVALVIGLAALLAGCGGGALVPSRSVSGQSGSIAWEVRGVARNEEFEALRQQKLISEAEYQATRPRILQGL